MSHDAHAIIMNVIVREFAARVLRTALLLLVMEHAHVAAASLALRARLWRSRGTQPGAALPPARSGRLVPQVPVIARILVSL